MKRCSECFVQWTFAHTGGTKCYFHNKREQGLIGPLWEYIDEVEINATMDGRLHQDGRRLDHYVIEAS